MHDDAMAGFYAAQEEDRERLQQAIDDDKEQAAREREANDRISERGERFPWEWP